MTIARRLLVLLATPLLILIGIGVITRYQMAEVSAFGDMLGLGGA